MKARPAGAECDVEASTVPGHLVRSRHHDCDDIPL